MAERSPDGFIVSLIGPGGTAVGVGALVGPRQIITCAHVVNHALGLDPRAHDRPTAPVTVRFPLLDAPTTLLARVGMWVPPPTQGAAGDDLAGLTLDDDPAGLGAKPARLAVNPPAVGLPVRVFGYAGTPPRPDGAWVATTVRGKIEGGRLQLESGVDAALRVQPGYSGAPVWDPAAGLVVGLVAAAAPGRSGERDSYAITADRLRLAWPDVLGIDARRPRRHGGHQQHTRAALPITVLHVSDPQFGRHHLFGGNGLTLSDQAHDTLHARLHDDLAQLADQDGLHPNLIVVTGDLAEWGLRSELDHAFAFVAALAETVQLPRHRVAIVPGNHDVNRVGCEAYVKAQQADEREPVPPYYPKWTQFAAAFDAFYAGVNGVSFTPDEPWTLFDMPELSVVIAGLNSTMAESHRDEDHYGWLGEHQLRWFADRLADYRSRGWLRLAAVHHNVVRGALLDDENLRDADDLDRILGEPRLANLLLHGHTHDGRLHRLPSGLVAVSTGSAAVKAEARPAEIPNQYQLLTIDRDGITRHARQYALGQRRWVGDTRVSRTGSQWQHRERHQLTDVDSAFPLSTQHDELFSARGRDRSPLDGDGLLARVAEATRVSFRDASVTLRPDADYLRVSNPIPGGGGAELWPVGVVDGPATAETLDRFLRQVHARFAAADPSVRSQLVHAGPPASEDLIARARARGVRLRSFVDYQGLLDLRPLVARQIERLDGDRIYPAGLYVPQRYRLIGSADPDAIHADVAAQVTRWLAGQTARLVMVLGDFGRGKTSLLRWLARTLPATLPDLLPVLVELRSLEKAPSLDELLGQHLIRHGVEDINPAKLRYMIRSGRLALLFDGFDELELRVGYANAADYLHVLLESVDERAKVVLTSRTQHFQSTDQVRTALGERVAARAASRIVVLEDFTSEQILRFLTNLYAGDAAAAQARFDLMAEIEDLLGLARNPRMLAFIADIDERRLRGVQEEHGRISAAELYRELVDFWLVKEADRQRPRGGTLSLDERERLAACAKLADRLWASGQPAIPMADLPAEVSATLTRLAERGYSADQAAHAIGSGSLLVRTDDATFTFVHQSVMEWLVAYATALTLGDGAAAGALVTRRLSRLMVDFLVDLAGHDPVGRWAQETMADPDASEVAKQNALAIDIRLATIGVASALREPRQHLAGVDLRGEDLTKRSLRRADLRGATLSGMRLLEVDLSGADLTRADLTRVRMVGGSLINATLTGSVWDKAALLGVAADESGSPPALAGAAIAGRDLAAPHVAASGAPACLAFGPRGDVIALGRGCVVEIVDLHEQRVVRTFGVHAAPVTAVAFSPDATMIATASHDRTARIWDVDTGHLRAILRGHTGSVNAVTFSPNATMIATASRDRTARLWRLATGKVRTVLTGHTDWVNAVAFSPDATMIATASRDRTARLWTAATGQGHTVLTGHTGAVNAAVFSPDAAQLATASHDRTARLWDLATGQVRTTLAGHAEWVTAVAFSPDGTLLATSSRDRTAGIWDAATGRSRALLTGHTAPVNAVAFSPDATLIATASADRTARTWDLGTGHPRATLAAHITSMNAIAFAPHAPLLATASADGTARIWNVPTGQAHTTVDGHSEPVIAVAFSPDATLLATACDDGTARLWDVAARHTLTTLVGHTGPVSAVAFSPDGALIATASADRTARLWDPRVGHIRTTLAGHTSWVTAVAFSPDATLIATASADRTVRIWDLTGVASPIQTDGCRVINAHARAVTSVAFAPAATLLATASDDRTVRIWDPASGRALATLTGHSGPVTAVAFSPDGALVATAARDLTARIWDLATGKVRATLTGHTGTVNAVAFSPDATLLATASDDGTARLWDVATGDAVATLIPLPGEGYAVLLPDGSYKVWGDPGETLWWAMKLCRFAPGELDPHVPQLRRLPADAPILPRPLLPWPA